MLGNIWLALDRCTSCPSASKTKWLEGGFIKHGERVDLDRVEDLLTFGRNLDFQNDFQLGPLPCLTNKRDHLNQDNKCKKDINIWISEIDDVFLRNPDSAS